MTSHSFYVEHKVGEDWIEYEYEVEYEYEPYVAARISGPPERCSPAEGGYAEDFEGPVKRRLTQDKNASWETVPYSVFVEGVIESQDIMSDPLVLMRPKTVHEKALDYIQNELDMAGEQAMRDAADDADEDRFDALHDEGRWGSRY